MSMLQALENVPVQATAMRICVGVSFSYNSKNIKCWSSLYPRLKIQQKQKQHMVVISPTTYATKPQKVLFNNSSMNEFKSVGQVCLQNEESESFFFLFR